MANVSKKSEKKAENGAQFMEINKFLAMSSDTNRLRILFLLSKGSLNVSEIHTKLKLPQNLTSHHISKLKSANLLLEKREGTFRHYSVNVKQLRDYLKDFRELMNV